MPDIDLFNRPTAPPVECGRCGRIFEGPIYADDGRTVLIPGHVQGDPRTCHPKPELRGSERDARIRRARRQGV